MNTTNLNERIMFDRRSIRRYQDRPVAQHTLETVLTAALWAPSAHNRQPWRFAVVTSPEQRRALALAMGVHLRAALTADNVPPDVIEKDTSRSYSRISSAPALI